MSNEIVKQRLRILYQEKKIVDLDIYVEKGLLTEEEASAIKEQANGNI